MIISISDFKTDNRVSDVENDAFDIGSQNNKPIYHIKFDFYLENILKWKILPYIYVFIKYT